MAERPAPPASELLYVPEPSFLPAIAAIGLAGVLTGIFVWWPYGVIGVILALVAVVGMLRGASRAAARLPRRQTLTSAVLPPVPPRQPDA